MCKNTTQIHQDEKEAEAKHCGGQNEGKEVVGLQLRRCIQNRIAEPAYLPVPDLQFFILLEQNWS